MSVHLSPGLTTLVAANEWSLKRTVHSVVYWLLKTFASPPPVCAVVQRSSTWLNSLTHKRKGCKFDSESSVDWNWLVGVWFLPWKDTSDSLIISPCAHHCDALTTVSVCKEYSAHRGLLYEVKIALRSVEFFSVRLAWLTTVSLHFPLIFYKLAFSFHV